MTVHCSCMDGGSVLLNNKMVESLGRQKSRLNTISNFDIFQWRNDILSLLSDRNKKEMKIDDHYLTDRNAVRSWRFLVK